MDEIKMKLTLKLNNLSVKGLSNKIIIFFLSKRYKKIKLIHGGWRNQYFKLNKTQIYYVYIILGLESQVTTKTNVSHPLEFVT